MREDALLNGAEKDALVSIAISFACSLLKKSSEIIYENDNCSSHATDTIDEKIDNIDPDEKHQAQKPIKSTTAEHSTNVH